jgi:hypothetical protein
VVGAVQRGVDLIGNIASDGHDNDNLMTKSGKTIGKFHQHPLRPAMA